ncbi:Fur-regulated basic protein FbpA [Ralstonia pickettii]|nr:Fur-regulated basic protein FbpA [Ralstonia pickettii]
MNMQEIDKALRNTEIRQRRKALISNIRRHQVYKSRDGRELDALSLSELERLNIEVRNEVGRKVEVMECQEQEQEINIMREKYYSRG